MDQHGTRTIDRLGFLGSLVAVVILVIDFSLTASPPDIKDSAGRVATFYADHHTTQMNGAFVMAIAAAFMLIFVVHLWRALQLAEPVRSAWPALALAGGVIAVGGVFLTATVIVALSDAADHGFTPDQLRALNALGADDFAPMAFGFALLALGAGVSLVRSELVPAAVGWIGIALGILGFTPLGFVSLLGILLWLAALGVTFFWSPPVRVARADASVVLEG